MQMSAIPFGTTDWSQIERTEHKGERGVAYSGTLKGKTRVRDWQGALKRIPDLHFELVEVFTCVNSIVIYYKAVLGKLATEVFLLNEDGKAYRALAHYDR